MSQPMSQLVVREGRDFGRAVAAIRRAHGLTQEEFAARTGLSRTYLSQIEAGRSTPLLEHILDLLRRNGAEISVQWHANG